MKKVFLFALLTLLAVVGAQAQNITVHGTVLSKADDEPLIGASVVSEANHNAAVTDIDGRFTISAPQAPPSTFPTSATSPPPLPHRPR